MRDARDASAEISGLAGALGRWCVGEKQTTGLRRRVSMPAAGVEIKTSTTHVEAAIRVISGRGFNSPRLHSTRCARSWRAFDSAEYGLAHGRPHSGRVECPE